jgi:hypothetical protein
VSYDSGWTRNLSDAQREADRYPVGAAVTVHYDPADPGRAVLVPGVGWSDLTTRLLLAGLLALFALIFGVVALAALAGRVSFG